MGVCCQFRRVAVPKQFLVCIFFISASGVRESDEQKVRAHVLGASRATAGGPDTMNSYDLFNIHDLLLVGYWAPMTKGPHLRERTLSPPYSDMMSDLRIPAWPENEGDDYYAGLKETRKGAVTLAKIIKDLHPVKACRDEFEQNEQDAGSNDEQLVEMQAATAWSCVGVQETDVILCGDDGRHCGEFTTAKPLTKIRHEGTNTLFAWEEMEKYRNFELKIGNKLGACFQPLGTGGPKKQMYSSRTFKPNADKIFKERIGYGTENQRKTAWLRACSYWSAFHALAIRADAKGGIFPNQLLGSIVRIISGGALFCGG